MPPHLQLTLLNVPAQQDGNIALPRPQHVVLNHLYCQRSGGVDALVIGTTHRYRNKYVTTVIYKPRQQGARRTAVDSGALPAHVRLPQQAQAQAPARQLGGPQQTSPRPIPPRTNPH